MQSNYLEKGVDGSLQTQLCLLEEIQEIDIAIGRINKERTEFPARKEKLIEEAKKLEAEMESLLLERGEFEKKKAALEDDALRCDEKISKNEERLRVIKNEKQYKAAEKETNTAKKKKVEINKEIARVTDIINAKDELLEIITQKSSEKREEIESLDAEMEVRFDELDRLLEEHKLRRSKAATDLSPGLLRQYELIRSKRQGLGIVAVKDGICQGCHMNIRPQLYIQIQCNPDEVISCPHCHRILYFKSKPQNI